MNTDIKYVAETGYGIPTLGVRSYSGCTIHGKGEMQGGYRDSGWVIWCKACGRERRNLKRRLAGKPTATELGRRPDGQFPPGYGRCEKHPESARIKNGKDKNGNSTTRCRDCRREAGRKYHARHRDKQNAKSKAYYDKRKEGRDAKASR